MYSPRLSFSPESGGSVKPANLDCCENKTWCCVSLTTHVVYLPSTAIEAIYKH